MPPKPLEGTLQKFKEEQIKLFNRTPQDESVQLGMLSEHMIRQVWAEALRYGASVLPEEVEHTCMDYGQSRWQLDPDMVDTHNKTLRECRSSLLEEADKATK